MFSESVLVYSVGPDKGQTWMGRGKTCFTSSASQAFIFFLIILTVSYLVSLDVLSPPHFQFISYLGKRFVSINMNLVILRH